MYATVYFVGFTKPCYSFECTTCTPKIFETITVHTKDGVFEGVVVDITTTPEYPISVYKI